MADQTFQVGPFAGVRYTSEPYDEAPDVLHQMVNGYVPDPVGRSAAYSRPGFVPFGGVDAPVTATGTVGTFHTHTGTDGTTYNFVAMDGALYRDAGNGTLTDVTPANLYVPTDAACDFCSLTDTLVFSNGQTTPMALTNLGSTPVTATPIPFADAINLFTVSPDNTTRIATISFPYNIQGTNYTKTGATPIGGTALPAGTIPSGQFGAFIATIGTTPAADPTITAIGDTYTTGYASSALAIAAAEAYVAANPIADTLWYIGYFIVEASGGNFVAGTTALTGKLTGYAGYPPPWTAYGPPVVYAGSLFFILDELPEFTPPNIYTTVSGRTSIAWSEPNLPLEGYRQADYDNVWELTQTASDPLFALAPTNDALYYSRRYGWGGLAGAPNINFQNTATQDIVSGNIGCVAPRSVQVFLNYVYFLDANGRPYRFATGGTPEPLWLQLRAWYDDYNRVIDADGVEDGAWAVIEPNLNVLLFRVPRGGTAFPDDPLHVLDALTGVYMGTWEPTNGSGVTTATLTCDYVTGVGEAIEVRIPLPDGDVAVSVVTT